MVKNSTKWVIYINKKKPYSEQESWMLLSQNKKCVKSILYWKENTEQSFEGLEYKVL